MALEIALVDEKGQKIQSVHDRYGLLIPLIERGTDENSQCLRFIDPYGDTVFNRLQLSQLLRELNQLEAITKDDQEHELIRKIEDLVTRGQGDTHLYIKFYGD